MKLQQHSDEPASTAPPPLEPPAPPLPPEPPAPPDPPEAVVVELPPLPPAPVAELIVELVPEVVVPAELELSWSYRSLESWIRSLSVPTVSGRTKPTAAPRSLSSIILTPWTTSWRAPAVELVSAPPSAIMPPAPATVTYKTPAAPSASAAAGA